MEGVALRFEGVALGLELGGGLALVRVLGAQGLERLVEGVALRFEGVAQRFHLHQAAFNRRRPCCSL